MNKSDLILMLCERAGVPKKKAEDVIQLIFDMMSDALIQGGRIEIRGFGSFAVKEYGSYQGRNPRTGESIHVSPKKLPFFKVGKELRERVDNYQVAPSVPQASFPEPRPFDPDDPDATVPLDHGEE